MGKTLVTYFSATGATKRTAEKIAGILKADIFEIEPVVKYTNEDIKRFYPKQVLIKLSEMYLIAAECKMRLGQNDALESLNILRRSRIPNSTTSDKTSVNQDVLIAEMRREFIGEGQLFYEYKRLNSPILNIVIQIDPNNSVFVFPLPEAEKEYGIYQ